MSINYRILKACDHSPRHKSAMVNALNALPDPSVARCAAVLHKMCKNLSIADFPNPFPHDEPDHMLWGAVFSGETPLTDAKPEVGVAAAPLKGWPKAWEDDAPRGPENTELDRALDDPELGSAKGATVQTAGPGAPDDPRDPNAAPADDSAPNLAKPDLPVMDSEGPTNPPGPPVTQTIGEGPLEQILGDSTDAGKGTVDVGPGTGDEPIVPPVDPSYPVANRAPEAMPEPEGRPGLTFNKIVPEV